MHLVSKVQISVNGNRIQVNFPAPGFFLTYLRFFVRAPLMPSRVDFNDKAHNTNGKSPNTDQFGP